MNSPTNDEEHLRLLAIFHYVLGGLTALFACLPLVHVTFGLLMIFSPQMFAGQSNEAPPLFVGWFVAGFGAFFFFAGQTLAICMLLAGRRIQRRTHYMFVFVTACIECVLMPFGTVLGVFTILVLSRESVKTLFQTPPATPAR